MKIRNRKKHVHLPLKIPQNIIDVLVSYKEWADAGGSGKYHKTKDQLLKELNEACKKWHLYVGYESMAGSFFIYTKVGVYVYAHISNKEPLVIQQCNICNPWDGEYFQRPREKVGDKVHIYHWKNYEPMTFPE